MPYLFYLGLDRKNDSLKYKTDFFSFRDRRAEKEISPNRFITTTYLSKEESIQKALKDA